MESERGAAGSESSRPVLVAYGSSVMRPRPSSLRPFYLVPPQMVEAAKRSSPT